VEAKRPACCHKNILFFETTRPIKGIYHQSIGILTMVIWLIKAIKETGIK